MNWLPFCCGCSRPFMAQPAIPKRAIDVCWRWVMRHRRFAPSCPLMTQSGHQQAYSRNAVIASLKIVLNCQEGSRHGNKFHEAAGIHQAFQQHRSCHGR